MYQALYRKWRPKVFEDVAGQPHITTTLKNELENGRIAHAYIFTGSRGTGKTTCAKILAKAVNCLNPHNGDPCNECEICRGIDSGAVLDVVEIDAASNNGVDNIRDLREEAGFTPATAKYRVYIIDEAHMLSTGAFNALLKTLEEPPAYVIFILATTEVHKIPATIMSRCQRFDFRRIPNEDIIKRLSVIAENENIKIDDKALSLIARVSDGGLRDAVSLLDQCAGNEFVDEKVVSETAGIADRAYLNKIADAVGKQDAGALMQIINSLYNSSKDCERLCAELIWHFRNLMIIKTVSNTSFLNLPEEETENLKNLSKSFSAQAVLNIIDSLQETAERIHKSTSRRVELEMGLLKICSPELDSSNTALLKRVADLENKLKDISFNGIKLPKKENINKLSVPADENTAVNIPEEIEIKAQPETENKPSENNISEEPFTSWPEVLEQISSSDAPLCGVLNGSQAIIRGNHVLVDVSNSMFSTLIKQQSHQKALVEAVRKITGKPYKVGIFKKGLNAAAVQKEDKMDEIINNLNAGGVEVKIV